MINVQEVKEKILAYLNEKGPSLPIPISKNLNIQSMLASAILSELINEKKVEISNLRVGNSPLYFIPKQNERLEPFAESLHGVEKEAFNNLRENQILIDSELEPAERVALRHIKDFAFSFKSGEHLIWRYFRVPEHEAKEIYKNQQIPASKIVRDIDTPNIQKPHLQEIKGIRDVSQSLWQDIEKQQYKEDIRVKMGRIAEEIAEKQKEFENAREEIINKIEAQERKVGQNPEVERLRQEILEKTESIESFKKKTLERPKLERIEKKGKKQDPKQIFLAAVKEFILKQDMELVSIEGLQKREILAKVRRNSVPDKIFLLIALDQKKLAENDVVKANRKALKLKLPFYIAFKGEFSRKIREKIDAFKNIQDTGTLA
jgi:hypothetical protein